MTNLSLFGTAHQLLGLPAFSRSSVPTELCNNKTFSITHVKIFNIPTVKNENVLSFSEKS
jgi:hypothetical protein